MDYENKGKYELERKNNEAMIKLLDNEIEKLNIVLKNMKKKMKKMKKMG